MDLVTPAEMLERRSRGQSLLRSVDDQADCRVAVLSTSNVDLLPALLAERLHAVGRRAAVYSAPFGQYMQEALAPDAKLYAFRPQHVALILDVEDVLQDLWQPTNRFAAQDLIAARLNDLIQYLRAISERLPEATQYVVINRERRPPVPYVLDRKSDIRGCPSIDDFERRLLEATTDIPHVIIVDWESAVRTFGVGRICDDRLWYLARMRLSPQGLALLAETLASAVHANMGGSKKVVALDLDDTLWGGVVGEAGLKGLELGNEGLGLAFVDFQRELLRLHRVGVLVALCSKNNPADAWEVFDKHPEMVLRREHITLAEINWEEKAGNLRRLAQTLNLGLNSFVFLDDNPVEREWVRRALPDVVVPELPSDPTARPAFLRDCGLFNRIEVTGADLERASSYRADSARAEAKKQTSSLEEFLASLEQRITIEPVDDRTVARAAQMCQRTNQFNLSSKRYTAAELQALMASPDWTIRQLSVRDRFGDYGITGLAIIKLGVEPAELDTFLLSCRVLGRRVEHFFLNELLAICKQRGRAALHGRLVANEKNRPIQDFFKSLGFLGEAESTFTIDASTRITCPNSDRDGDD